MLKICQNGTICDNLKTMFLVGVYQLLVKLSKKMAGESTKCYSTAIYTTIMVVLSLQLLGTIEKQVFDFLGYMWAPIIGNFFQIICSILGIFGTYQFRPVFIAIYSTWSLIWLGWNIFVICLYLEVGVLNRNKELYILTMGTKSKSWWLDHGIGCRVNNESWVEGTAEEQGRLIPPEEFVEGCILEYYYVEVIHAAIQCLLALTGFVFTLMAIYIYSEEQESSKYSMSARTYISPKDYPNTHYRPIRALKRAKNSAGEPVFVSYAEAEQWASSRDTVDSFLPIDDIVKSDNVKGDQINQCAKRGSDNRLTENQTGDCDNYQSDGGNGTYMGNQSVIKGDKSYSMPVKGGNSNSETGFQPPATKRQRVNDSASLDNYSYSHCVNGPRAYNSGVSWSSDQGIDCMNVVSPL